MPVLEIRRHAERNDKGDPGSALSSAGAAMAAALGKRLGPFALVVSSPLPRARESARLMAGRVDALESGLLPELGGIVSNQLFGELRTLADWARLLRERDEAQKFAAEQLRTWAQLQSRVGDVERILAISHGGIIELPALRLAEELRTPLSGPALGYCEGVRVDYQKGTPVAIEVLRL